MSSKRAHRPCDVCRRRKRNGGKPCGRCIEHEFSCTYEQRAIERTTVAAGSYAKSLQKRIDAAESLLRESNIVHTTESSSPASLPPSGPDAEYIARSLRALNTRLAPADDDPSFVEALDLLSLNDKGSHVYQGKSSQAILVKAAVDLKTSHSNTSSTPRCPIPHAMKTSIELVVSRGPPFPRYDFPEQDLTTSLIKLYFININIFFPLLHRPTFEEAFTANMHLFHAGFAGTLLLVCALGARYSADPRVHLPGGAHSSAGLRWFSQVNLGGQPPLRAQPTLYDLQCYCLAVQFLERTARARVCWTLVGFGIRLAQDIGAHRLKMRKRAPTSEEELEKRAYWVLILFDLQLSVSLGRAMALPSHEFDVDLPVQCDDEYWKAAPHNAAYCQPPETPSSVDFFTSLLKLNQIVMLALKFLYSTNESKVHLGTGEHTRQEEVVVEFDSALNTWFESVPVHLRWDPRRSNDVFFDQSAALHCSYYFVRILIHRPFIPAIGSAIPSSLPSLSICNTAARACIHVAEIQHQRRPHNPLVFGQTAVFTAGIVLLLNMWGGKCTGRVQDTDLSDVHRCIMVLRGHKTRWPSTSSLLDTLEQLIKVDQAPPDRSPLENYEPSPFTVGGEMPQLIYRGRAFNPALYDPLIADHFVGPASEDHARGGFSFPALDDFDVSSFANDQNVTMDMDTVTMWSAAPTSFEVSDWDLYLGNIADTMQENYRHVLT
ncbi:fungal-specific transcription factor domain-containing protein [Mycena rosella]|uniref:Fungal-specific transcription factor domain-containing protein n=1 Tax=Mycena rosella TaxID=1033263 RepID=A0AAD7G0Y0_MYCRO|nr:fungal-specific transcription factor domain-containing protein [Mycena rosella]